MISWQPILAAAIAAAGFSAAWIYQGAKYDSRIATISAEHSLVQATASARALGETTRLQRIVDEATAAAARRQSDLARDLSRAHHALAGLRSQTSLITTALPSASCTAVVEYAATTNTVLDECGSALVEMAGNAQGHANDALRLSESWPR